MKRGRPRNNQGRNQNRKPNPNRALESHGPGIKVRGAASTIFEKYTQLASDATTSGDRVSAEYYYQYAEHYGRLVQAQLHEREKREEAQRTQRDAKQAEYDARKAARQAEQAERANPEPSPAEVSPVEPVIADEKPAHTSRRKPAAKPVEPNGEPPAPMDASNTQNEDAADEKPAPVRRRVRRTRTKPEAGASN